MRSTLVFNLLLNIVAASAALSGPSASIEAGTLHGAICNGSSKAAYFKSIPYAQPPVGELRFAAPQPYEDEYPSEGRDATQNAPACIQFGSAFAEAGPASEDCLFIGVWTPDDFTPDSALPVKVWIYGGSEDSGGISNPLYDGCSVAAAGDALLVSINYRLGPLGFFATPIAGVRGNQAIQDLVLALEWIQENIAAFGGDPDKVVVHGQSAGSINTYILATLESAPTLMRAAISESGGGVDVFSRESGLTLGQAFAAASNCSASDLACLQSKSVADLKLAFSNISILSIGNKGAIGCNPAYQFAPFVDGLIIPSQPSLLGPQVPMIFGSNKQEGSIFAVGQFASLPNGPADATAQDYTQFLEDNFGSRAAAAIQEYYPLSAFTPAPLSPAFSAIATIITDFAYKCPAQHGLSLAARNGLPGYGYTFLHSPHCSWLSMIPQAAVGLVGPTHTAEIPFVFGITDYLPPPDGTCTFTPAERRLSAALSAAWTSMGDSGTPGAEMDWPAYTKQDGLGLAIGGDGDTDENVPIMAGPLNFTVCPFWHHIREEYLQQHAEERMKLLAQSYLGMDEL